MSSRSRIAALLLPLVVLAGCAADEDTDASGSNGDAPAANPACTPAEGELVDLDAQPGEPTLRIPLPDGWERNTQMDSELIRLVLTNPGLARDAFAPNLVVTAERSPADVDAAFDNQLSGIGDLMGQPDLEGTPGEICGHPSMTVEYTLPSLASAPERPAVVQVVVVPHGSQTLTYAMTAQTPAPADPVYRQDVAAMLAGVQIVE